MKQVVGGREPLPSSSVAQILEELYRGEGHQAKTRNLKRPK